MGEGVVGWDETDYRHYHAQLLSTDSLLQALKSRCTAYVRPAQIDTLRTLLAEKEAHLRHIMEAMERQDDADSLLVNHLSEVAGGRPVSNKKPLQTFYGLQGLILYILFIRQAHPLS